MDNFKKILLFSIFVVVLFMAGRAQQDSGLIREMVMGPRKESPLVEDKAIASRLSAPTRENLPSGLPGLKPVALTPQEIEAVRSEIKISLASIYSGQKAFFAEYHRYSTDLFHGIGYTPDAKIRISKAGFLAPYYPREVVGEEDPRFHDTDAYLGDQEISEDQRFEYAPSAAGVSLGSLSSFCQQGCTASEKHFEVIAAALLVEGGPLDVWSINEKKEIRHLQDGTDEGAR